MNLVEMYTKRPEWERELDHVQFEYRGYICLITRTSMGILCGYVGLPNYSQYEDDYLIDNVCPHGGLSFEGSPIGCLPTTDSSGAPLYWIGFHCGHTGDLVPAIKKTHKSSVYKNFCFVEGEIENMVNQIEYNRQRHSNI